ncbi:MAG: hypothetical protein JXR76_22225 [Deltaproteobacteria bacterium]|nr:hypothetical protein [Deltaproteobacteria bacterium]
MSWSLLTSKIHNGLFVFIVLYLLGCNVDVGSDGVEKDSGTVADNESDTSTGSNYDSNGTEEMDSYSSDVVSSDSDGTEPEDTSSATDPEDSETEPKGEKYGQFIVVDAGSGKCDDGTGVVFDRNTNVTWMRTINMPLDGLSWPEADEFCRSKGMRLPSPNMVWNITQSERFKEAFPCEWESWTTLAVCDGGWGCPTASNFEGLRTFYQWIPTDDRHSILHGVLCVSGGATEWIEHEGIFWSERRQIVVKSNSYSYTGQIEPWYAAYNDCTDLGGELPTLQELRTLIKGCPETEVGGICPELPVLELKSDYSVEMLSEGCGGCESIEGGFSALNDGDAILWSLTDEKHCKYRVDFASAEIYPQKYYNGLYYTERFFHRCVRRTTAPLINDERHNYQYVSR